MSDAAELLSPAAIRRHSAKATSSLQADRTPQHRHCPIAFQTAQKSRGAFHPPAFRIEQEDSNLKCRFTPLSVGNHTYIGKSCVVESAGIGCNVRIEDGCVLVRCRGSSALGLSFFLGLKLHHCRILKPWIPPLGLALNPLGVLLH